MRSKNCLLQLWKLLIVGSLFIGTSCEDEKALEATPYEEELPYEFPQGKNEWDREIQKIQENFGIYVVYKGFKTKDLNRGWVIPRPQEIFVGNGLTDDQVSFYFDFVRDNLFRYLDPDFARPLLPKYFYLVDDMHVESDQERKRDVSDKFDGLDFWAISFTDDKIEKLTDADIKQARNKIVYALILKGVEDEVITEPTGFTDGVDYRTALSYYPGNENYFLNRGFVYYVKEDFTRESVIEDLGVLTNKNADLLCYVRQILFETPDKFQAKYPQADYALINRRYRQVLNHFKMNYHLDLNAIALGSVNE